MSLNQLITQYGYPGVFVGAFLQSDPVLVMGGISAHRGFLEFPWVILFAFSGSLSSELLLFYLGHVNGHKLLEHRPSWKQKSAKVLATLEKRQWLFMLGYRFIPGLARLTPVLVGASGFKPSRFIIVNIPGAALWATVITGLGALFSRGIELLLGDFHHYEVLIFSVLAGLALIFLLVSLYNSRARV